MRHYLMLNSKLGKKVKNCEQEITWIVLQYFFLHDYDQQQDVTRNLQMQIFCSHSVTK